jgi:hypothetical protein
MTVKDLEINLSLLTGDKEDIFLANAVEDMKKRRANCHSKKRNHGGKQFKGKGKRGDRDGEQPTKRQRTDE